MTRGYRAGSPSSLYTDLVTVPEPAVHDPSSLLSPAESGEGVPEADDDFGAEMSDEELGELLVREITIDGMCGVY